MGLVLHDIFLRKVSRLWSAIDIKGIVKSCVYSVFFAITFRGDEIKLCTIKQQRLYAFSPETIKNSAEAIIRWNI